MFWDLFLAFKVVYFLFFVIANKRLLWKCHAPERLFEELQDYLSIHIVHYCNENDNTFYNSI